MTNLIDTSTKLTMTSKELHAKELFDKYDTDQSGTISLSEFQAMLPAIGIDISLPKSIEYFRLCDKDGSGKVDFDEFKVALFVCDTEEGFGFNPGNIMRPKDAFGMFDKDQSGQLDEIEFHFLLKYLGIDIDENTHERMFRQYDRDDSGFIEYDECKKIWLRLSNPRKELEDRGVDIPTLATRPQLIRMLDEILEDEEKKEAVAVQEAKRWREEQMMLRSRKKCIAKALRRSFIELYAVLDAGGQVYVFGSGTLNQFSKPLMERAGATSSLCDKEAGELLAKLWNSRIRGTALCQDAKEESSVETSHDATKRYPFQGLSVQENTVALWARNTVGVAIGDSTIIAHTGDGIVYSWGGHDQWWHEIEADSCLQNETRGLLTARSNLMQGRRSGQSREKTGRHEIPIDTHRQGDIVEPLSLSMVHDDQYNKVKKVLQYYGVWTTPEKEGVDPQEYSERCLQNYVTRERLLQSLQIRGRSCEQKTKREMLHILYDDLVLECKVLGEVVHLYLRELEKEMVHFHAKRKFKLVKRRQVEFADRRRPVSVEERKHSVNVSNVLNEEPACGSTSENGHPNRSALTDPNDASSLSSHPTSKWKMIASGANHVGLLDEKGTLFMYGLNAVGRLGLRDEDQNKIQEQEDVYRPKPVAFPDNSIVSSVSCGHSHTAAINGGDLFMWGSTTAGKLGIGDLGSERECYCATPMKVSVCSYKEPISVISCGSNHTACISRKGTLFVWGCNDGYRLGLGDASDRYQPTLVESLPDVSVNVSCGNCQTLVTSRIDRETTIVNNSQVTVLTGGKLYVAGQAGVLGSTFQKFGQYESFTTRNNTIPPKPIQHISAGFSHQSAVSVEGELFTWGGNHGGCCCHDPLIHFISNPTHVECLYNRPSDLAISKPTHSSTPYGNQPFYEIDLQEMSTIHEVKLWNILNESNNPAVRKDKFTSRLFPCWIMISQKPFPPSVGEGALDEALEMSICKKRLIQNRHESIWHPPRNTIGRFVRIQLETTNLMEFEKLEVFGRRGIDKSTGQVSSATCGKRVTAAVIKATDNLDDINLAYQRAITADSYNEIILQQFEIFNRCVHPKSLGEQKDRFDKVGCMLCTGGNLCEKCQLKNDFRDIITAKMDIEKQHSLGELSSVLLDISTKTQAE